MFFYRSRSAVYGENSENQRTLVFCGSKMEIDTLIINGRVIDPINNRDEICDVALKSGKVFKVGRGLKVVAKETYDASGCLVTPGLIDAHVHCYEYATPLGISPDNSCLARGVTTIVDAGSSGKHFSSSKKVNKMKNML